MKKTCVIELVAFIVFATISVSCKTQSGKTTLATANDSLSYAWGIILGEQVKQNGLDNVNAKAVMQALEDFSAGKAKMDKKFAIAVLEENFKKEQTKKAEKNLKEGTAFLEENKKKQGVITLPSGLQYTVLKEGTGPMPKATDIVETHYHGTLIDGKVFDSSVERGEPVKFPVNQVIPGWTEALQLMKVGSKWKIFVPAQLAYGEMGRQGAIDPNSVLIFEIELLGIEPPQTGNQQMQMGQ